MTAPTMGETSKKDDTAAIHHYRRHHPPCLLFPTILTTAIIDMTPALVQTAATVPGGAESAPKSTANDNVDGDGNSWKVDINNIEIEVVLPPCP